MPADVEVNIDQKDVLRNLSDLSNLKGMDAVMKMVGAAAMADQQRVFRRKSQGRQWAPLSDVTVILRRPTRGGGKIKSAKDIATKRSTLKQLVASGRLLKSFSPGNPDQLIAARKDSVKLAILVPYAKKHQAGGTTKPFRFDAKAYSRAVHKGKKGSWNPYFFSQRNRLRKMEGKRYNMPAREVFTTPEANAMRRYAKIVAAALAAIGEGRRPKGTR